MKKFVWQGQTFWLHPHRLMYWEDEKVLIGSDLHLGKIGHFRKAGIALPQNLYKEDLHRLFAALQYFQPERFFIVGDLFHSKANKEMDWFLRWRNDVSSIPFKLIRGNHDSFSDQWYHQHGIDVCPHFTSNGIHFEHHPKPIPAGSETEAPYYDTGNNQQQIKATISGHVHPGIRLHGFARQSVQLPCFYFSSKQCILPAFGLFTGLYTVRPQTSDDIFVLLENEVMALGKSNG